MPATAPPRTRRATATLAIALLLGIAAIAACDPGGDTAAFDVAGPCTTDGQRPGAYPELEAMLPGSWEDRQPDTLASGRTCTRAALGSLVDHGIAELRFAGATWDTGGRSGFTVAVFEAEGLEPAQVIEFYAGGVTTDAQEPAMTTTATTVAGRPAVRLDVAGPDGSTQVVVAWPTGADGQVAALLTANTGDIRIGELLATFGGG